MLRQNNHISHTIPNYLAGCENIYIYIIYIRKTPPPTNHFINSSMYTNVDLFRDFLYC